MTRFHEVVQFYAARRARLRGFRFKDWSDFEPSGDRCAMLVAAEPYDRIINNPVLLTIKIPTSAE